MQSLQRILLAHGVMAVTGLVMVTGAASAAVTEFDFEGNAGSGLLPGNQVGPVVSDAIGSEIGNSLLFDDETNTLSFSFEFSGLSGGLFNAASGIHFHIADPGDDPFNQNGGIALNLNSGTDANVTIDTPLLATDGSVTSGTVTGSAILSGTQIDDLFDGKFYLNIHSGDFTGGELRGNLVVVPAPATAGMLLLAGLAGHRRRRSA